jgi:glucose dehydrogenase
LVIRLGVDIGKLNFCHQGPPHDTWDLDRMAGALVMPDREATRSQSFASGAIVSKNKAGRGS